MEPLSQDEISKTQKKRQADALKKLGLRLTQLSPALRGRFQLPAALEQAIESYQKTTSNGAKRRQSLYIGKLMRSCDSEKIMQIFASIEAEQQGHSARFHLAEQWRERLLNEEPALTEFIRNHHPSDVQKLRQLIKKAQQDKILVKNSGASKQLFQLIKGCLQ